MLINIKKTHTQTDTQTNTYTYTHTYTHIHTDTHDSLLKMEFTSHSKAIAFADDLIILTKGEPIVEAGNYMNLELRKFS
jgi:hypothetical protein